MPKFEKLRISLIREEPGELIGESGHEEHFRSRPEYLTAAFAEPRLFLHGKSGKRFAFDPLEMPDGYVGGFFKRERPVLLKRGNLAPYEAENYEGALAIVSVGSDQIAWVEHNPGIAAPRPLLESFFGYLLRNTDINDYEAIVRYIDSERQYWTVIRERRADIARIAFTFIPPNALGADDEIANLIKSIQQEAHPDTQQHVYKAAPGQMRPATPHLEASARIAMEGGGEATVSDVEGNTLYSSSSAKARTTENVPEQDMPTPAHPSFVRRAIARLFE